MGDGRRRAEADGPARHIGPRGDIRLGAGEFVQQPLAALQQQLPRLGDDDVASLPLEQIDAELAFQPLHLPGQRRLRDVQQLRRATEAAEPRDRHEILDLLLVQRRDRLDG